MILVRHAQPAIEPAVPPAEWRLSPAGRTQAGVLAERLSPLDPDRLFSSPEPKAVESAEIIGAVLGLDIEIVAEVREHDRSGAPWLDEPGAFEDRVRAAIASPFDRVFGNETAAQALSRFRSGIERVRSTGARDPVVVTHGTVMALYIAAELGRDAFGVWRELAMPCHVHMGRARPAPQRGSHDARNR